jgi:UDP-glucuronate 4-epimerase
MFEELSERAEREIRSRDWSGLWSTTIQMKQQALSLEQSIVRQAVPAPTECSPYRRYLVTGGAGFIGSHVVRKLLAQGHRVVTIDEFNDYYDPVLKWENVADLLRYPQFELHQADIRDHAQLRTLLLTERFDAIIHLAARAGVRPSLVDPGLYVTTNVLGTQNMLELAREFEVTNFVYASSSSVYGGNTDFPFSEVQNVDRPVSPYAATKKANELQAACYSHLYPMAVSGLRFFTVYGPGGRPDMAVRLFIEKLDRGEPIPLYGDGSFERDYTYVDDIVDGVLGVVGAASGRDGWNEVFNLGESDTTSVLELILMIAGELGKVKVVGEVKELSLDAQRKLIDDLTGRGLIARLPEQLGDVPKTYADISKARQMAGYQPKTSIAEGIHKTVRWHLQQQNAAIEPSRKRLQQAIRLQCDLRLRAGLDSAGRRKEPRYEATDASNLVSTFSNVSSYGYGQADEALACRAQRELAEILCDVAVGLRNAHPPAAC